MTVDAETAGFDPAKLSRLERHLNERYLMPGKIPLCLRVAKSVTAHDSALGMMDLERKKPMRDTIFRIYSMTKPITSIALMMLWEEGLFQLTDPVSKFIPSWSSHGVWNEAAETGATTRPPEQPMTVQHLLTHTAGLTYGGILPGME